MANAVLDALVAALHAAHKRSYGRPRITQALHRQGIRVGHERVRKSLQRLQLRPLYKRPYRVTTNSDHTKLMAPNVLDRRFSGWSMSDRMKAELACAALRMALWQRKPSDGLIVHTDRGSQYASDDYQALIDQHHITASMSRRANCWDNAVIQSFLKAYKVESVD